tara:strand:- start:3542 stop:3805 length:264 start_codon:yes stop_codon:yes gene_type:complete
MKILATHQPIAPPPPPGAATVELTRSDVAILYGLVGESTGSGQHQLYAALTDLYGKLGATPDDALEVTLPNPARISLKTILSERPAR